MNDVLSKIIDENSPRANPKILEGATKYLLHKSTEYLDSIFRSSISSLHRDIDLKYLGYRVKTCEEDFNSNFKDSTGKMFFDISGSSVYLVEFLFEYMGKKIYRSLYMPYSEDGNIIYFSGTSYNIVPVLSDTIITPSSNEVFVRLLKDKLIFKNKLRNFLLNGEKRYGLVIYSEILKTSTMYLTDNIGKPIAPVGLYLLGGYGLRETFRRYLNLNEGDYLVSTSQLDVKAEEYNIFSSTGIKPRYIKDNSYIPNTIRIYIKRNIELTQLGENIIYSIIYTYDQLPFHLKELGEIIKSNDLESELMYWRILLGRLIYKNSYSIDRISSDMNEHFYTLNGYIDTLIKEKLLENNLKVETLFDLIAIVMENYNKWLMVSKEYSSELDNRYIDIFYYLFYDIIVGFNKVILNLNKRHSKSRSKILDIKEINKVFSTDLNSKKIFKLVNTTSPSLALLVTDNCLDIKYPKITSILEDQSRGSGVRKSKTNQFPPNRRYLRAYDLYLGSILFITKGAPSPAFRFNLFMDYDIWSGRILIPDKTRKKLDKLEILLSGRSNYIQYDKVEESLD